jgi:glutathione S-transferase
MAEELVLYTNPMSRGRIAHWMLEEVGQPYRIEILDLTKREQKEPEFLKLNPMMFFGAGCIEAALVDRMFSRPMPDRPGALGYGSYADTLNALERAVAPGPFVLGERFSAADVYIGSEIGWGLLTKSLEPRQAFREYHERLTERPAFQRFSALNAPPKHG